jgi:pyridoxamine 5'-phosphate oxidase
MRGIGEPPFGLGATRALSHPHPPVIIQTGDCSPADKENPMQIANIRKEYLWGGLSEADMDADPIRQFERWFQHAVAAKLPEPNAMTLATATPDGQPSARIVLLKAFDASGFTFFTNYDSRKGRELTQNPRAALLLFWPELQRQVRIEGTVERVAEAESDAYFVTRPVGSRLGAWASRQSEVITGRDELEQRVRELAERYADGEVPRPPFWGGFRVRPLTIEFWQGRPDRLHDRLRYIRGEAGGWRLERLSP